ncbi:MAG: CRISPR-associated endonuclease Cas1 [Gammaproteobacteria bacterium]
MKPLYIKGVAGTAVAFDDPALTVEFPGKTRQLFPLARVSRIVVTGPVDWSMAALLSCADTGISIVFLTESGDVRARWLGCARMRQSAVQMFADFWQRADALDRYQDWFGAMERMAVRSSARRLGFADWQEADAGALRSWLEKSFDPAWRVPVRQLNGFLLATVLEGLGHAGLDARCDALHDERVQFAGDMGRLLLWDLYPALTAWKRKCPEAPDHQNLATFYENRLHRTENLLRGLLNKWHQYLLGLS